MRKVLLATTAIVGFAVAGAAQAATSPLTVTVGGSVDFVAGAAHESKASGAVAPSGGDFETIYSLDFGVAGKAANGIEYGGNIVIDNDIDAEDNFVGQGNNIAVSEADVFMSGAFGKVVLGDMRGATDLAVTAPNVGGIRYIDFLGAAAGTAGSFAKDLVIGIDGKDHSTNVTYFTPKVGNDMHKVQLGVTYAPEFNKYGSDVKLTRVAADEYKNVIKGALLYTGTFKPVAVKASANIISGTGESSAT
ncbi:MAG: porin, partial [Alphaproteobacteria bacterium]|nr:porin [Alphaproteobacteria bacterium]